jgi:LacI family repressor for deo operon, udp, cdd, tsx, nupC, and nupG
MGTVSVALPYDDRWFFTEALAGAVDRILGEGHEPIVHVVPPSPDAADEVAAAVQQDLTARASLGAVAVGFRLHQEHQERFAALQRPVVVIGGSATGFPTVLIDDAGASWTATNHLMQLGHRRIVHLAGVMHEQMDFLVHTRRARGYLRALSQAGLEPLIVETEFDQDDAYAAARTVLEGRDRPTAIFAVSDEIAFPVLAAARDLGLEIGADLSVVGFDDHPRAAAEDLTTIRQRPREQGAAAVELILNGIGRGPDPKQSRLMPTALVVRGSTRRIH